MFYFYFEHTVHENVVLYRDEDNTAIGQRNEE